MVALAQSLDTVMPSSVLSSLISAKIPSEVIDQIATVASDQDANDYLEIVKDLANTLADRCDAVAEAFKSTLAKADEFQEFIFYN
ncbi:hypothetical protein PMAYCL1PPCAC_09106 [Pristionchus mayeri]|uniref:Uncharacterized protein n=1 Tax=Pristionchus mayeri TaxID=1317129 RepID=A0AAN4ZDR8_9BILA|nr:hypothetical protein PMAYCL1PPCAC_09106 [Pristionchus mayeri]